MLKYKIYVLFLFILTLGSINYINANNNSLPLFGKVIYIDPGHGGLDPGAMYNGIKEKDINLEISKKLENKLTSMGAIVYLTRYDDYDLSVSDAWNRKRSDLSRRANVINRSGCDLYLSIHLNAEDSNFLSGAEVYYDTINLENEKLAKIFQNNFKKYLGSKRDYKENSTKYLQRRVNRPGVLLELGYLSNPSERSLLVSEEYQEKLANTVLISVNEFFSS